MDILTNGPPGRLENSLIPDAGSEYETEEEEEEEEDENDASFVQLRSDLLSRLQSPNFTSKLKSQIRASLALQLAPPSLLTAKAPKPPDPVVDLANAVCAQHLLASSCDFSLSVFLPESGLNVQSHPMGLVDLLRFLRIRWEGRLDGQQSDRSFLCLLMERLPSSLGDIGNGFESVIKQKEVKEVQTDGMREDWLEDRVKMVEVKRRMGWKRDEPFDVSRAFERYESHLESHIRATLLHESSASRTAELTRLVDEEKSRHSRELLTVTSTWETRLRDQAAAYESMHQRLHLAEQQSFTQRQELMQQHDELSKKETKIRIAEAERERELEEKERELVERAKQLAEVSKVLRAKDASIDEIVQSKLVETLKVKGKNLDEREEKLRKEEATLLRLKDHLTRTIISDSTADGITPMGEPKPFVQKIKTEFTRLHKENQKLKSRLSEVADYETTKQSLEVLEKEARNLRHQNNLLQVELTQERQEHTGIVRELTEKMVQPERSLDNMRRELDSAREKLLLETLRWETEKGKLKSTVKDRNREVDSLRDKVKELQEKVDSLQGKLARMQGMASQATWMMMQPSSVAAHNGAAPIPSVISHRFAAESPARDHLFPHPTESSSQSLRSIAEAKQRIRALEQEASTMQQHFSQYRRFVNDSWNPPTPNGSRFSELGPTAHNSGLILNPATLQTGNYQSVYQSGYSTQERQSGSRSLRFTQFIPQGSPRKENAQNGIPSGLNGTPVRENGIPSGGTHYREQNGNPSRDVSARPSAFSFANRPEEIPARNSSSNFQTENNRERGNSSSASPSRRVEAPDDLLRRDRNNVLPKSLHLELREAENNRNNGDGENVETPPASADGSVGTGW